MRALVWMCILLLPGPGARVRAAVRVVDLGSGRLRVVYQAEKGPGVSRGAKVLLGLPLEGEVSLEIVEAQVGEERSGGEAERDEGPAYLGRVGWWRRQRVAELFFAPDAQGRVYDRVVADLYFGGRTGSSPRGRQYWEESLYRHALANYGQAKRWRRPGRRVAAKAAVPRAELLLKAVVRREGIYRIGGRDLEEAGVALGRVDPAQLQLYYGGGRMLPLELSKADSFAFSQIPIRVEDGGDGRFDAEDFVLFRGEPVARWEYRPERGEYSFRRNLYTRDNVYWLAVGGRGKSLRIAAQSGARLDTRARRPEHYRARLHREEEQFIQIQTATSLKSGYEWFWEEFRGNARNFSAPIEDAAPGPVDIRIRFANATPTPRRFQVKWNDRIIAPVALTSGRADTVRLRAPLGAREGVNRLGLVHRGGQAARLDWFELEFNRRFAATEGLLIFDWPGEIGPGEVAEFHLEGFAERPRIFALAEEEVEIVDFVHEPETGTVIFQDRREQVPPHYLVVPPSRWRRPAGLALERPAHLREPGQGADYVIITHGDFAAAAGRLAAWRAEDARFGPPLRTKVVEVEDIYDEFSGGLLDPAAIRNFVKYAFENWDPPPLFITLFGDGTYDYKNNSNLSKGNWIPAFQDGDSTYDEWYVRVAGADPFPDLAVGRLPVQSAAEAKALVDKILAYERRPEVGPWQGRMLLVADDLRNPSAPGKAEVFFMNDAENLARKHLPPDLDLVKVYLAQFPLEGRGKPQARNAFIRRLNEGALILTYIGHGNTAVLAHEELFVVSRDLSAIDNGGRLPFFYAAASQVGPFDDPARQSMPEILLDKPRGGVIGAIAATRIGFHESNMILANQFHQQMFRSGRASVPAGLALMEAKALVKVNPIAPTGRRNVQRFSLFGDPAMHLARPRLRVELEVPQSLRALEEVHVQGRVLDAGGRLVDDYQGKVLLQVFDSAVNNKLDGVPYLQLGGPLFRGVSAVAGGRFETFFRVPKDITYRGRRGRLSAYAWSAARPAAFGAVGGRVLAGTAAGVLPDEEGPEISLGFLGTEAFESGDELPPRPVLRAEIRDPSGINITGETGHEIELRVDDELFRVTEAFVQQEGSYQAGRLEYALPALEPGMHEIRLKAWDSFNNSAQAAVQVRVGGKGGFSLSEVLFYPNPMDEEGAFTFVLSAAARVRFEVFTLNGRRVDAFETEGGRGYNQVVWRPPSRLAAGSYIYRIAAWSQEGERAEQRAVLQVLR